MTDSIQCAPFPNATVFASARKISRGSLAGGYRARVATVERSAWTAPCCYSKRSAGAFVTKADAMAAAIKAAEEAAATGFVPDF